MAKSNIKTPVEFEAFLTEFQRKIGRKLSKTLNKIKDTGLKKVVVGLEKEIPQTLYGMIVKAENSKLPGVLKFVNVMSTFAGWLNAKGWGAVIPILIPIIELTVKIIYQNTVETIFDKLGIEDEFEHVLGFEVGSEAKATTTVAKPPEPAPAKTG